MALGRQELGHHSAGRRAGIHRHKRQPALSTGPSDIALLNKRAAKKNDRRVFHEVDEGNTHVDRGCMHTHTYVCILCLTAALPLQRLVLEASFATALCKHSMVAGPARGSQEGLSLPHSPAPANAEPLTLSHPSSLSSAFKGFHTRLEHFFCLANSAYKCVTWLGNIHIFLLCISPRQGLM